MGPLDPNLRLENSDEDPEKPQIEIDWEAHLEEMPVACWIGDSQGGNVFVNRAYRELLGVSHLDLVHDFAWADYVHPDDVEGYVKAWQAFVDRRSEKFQELVRWVRPDNYQICHFAVRAQRLDSGHFQGWVRPSDMEQSLSRLERISNGHR